MVWLGVWRWKCWAWYPESIRSKMLSSSVHPKSTVTDVHERKAVMAREADAFIALSGGYGTMEELLEMITWSQLGILKKPCSLLHVDGYRDSSLALFDNGVEEGFVEAGDLHMVVCAPTAKGLLEKMEQYMYTPPHQHVAPRESWDMKKVALFPGQQIAR